MKSVLKRLAGSKWQYVRVTRHLAAAVVASYGQYDRECPLCGYKGKFLAEIHFPDSFVFDAICPSCSSQPRNRLLWVAVGRRKLITGTDSMLHFAPEACLRDRFRALAGSYATADLFADGVDHKLDITAIDMPDASFDVVLASHVLEHVDDAKALRELYRILRPGGRLLILVPVAEGWETTYENPQSFDPAHKALHYGKDNHVRRYGRDLRDRLKLPGFAVEAFTLDGADSVAYGLIPGENLFICTKPAA